MQGLGIEKGVLRAQDSSTLFHSPRLRGLTLGKVPAIDLERDCVEIEKG